MLAKEYAKSRLYRSRREIIEDMVYVSETDDDGGEWWSADCVNTQYRTKEEAVNAVLLATE